MYKRIMVPVDLAHIERLSRSLDCATELARLWNARIVFVGVTTPQPGALGHTPGEYADKLRAFAAAEGERRGVSAEAHTTISHDPRVDLDDALLREVEATGADLVVMQSHVPGIADYVWPSNGGKVAAHAGISVMLVRG